MQRKNILTWTFLLMTFLLFEYINGDGLRLPDQQPRSLDIQQQQQQQQQHHQVPASSNGEERSRHGKNLLSLFGFGNENDPYLARTNANCLSGDLSECFKTQALTSFDEIFYQNSYSLSDFARIVRLPESQQRSLQQEPFEYSKEPQPNDGDWDQLAKYALRRVERFVKSTALEVSIPEELTEAGRYQARFIGNDIDSELDVIEDKHAPLLTRKKLKKLFIPLLLVLKIFKLKLLLFLPFILGIAGLKKVLSLAAIVLPGLFVYFKLCRPPGAGGFGSIFGGKNTFPEYTPQGIGPATYYHHHEHHTGGNPYFQHQQPTFSQPYSEYYAKNTQQSNGISFGDSQDLAYQGYSTQYRNNDKNIQSTQK